MGLNWPERVRTEVHGSEQESEYIFQSQRVRGGGGVPPHGGGTQCPGGVVGSRGRIHYAYLMRSLITWPAAMTAGREWRQVVSVSAPLPAAFNTWHQGALYRHDGRWLVNNRSNRDILRPTPCTRTWGRATCHQHRRQAPDDLLT